MTRRSPQAPALRLAALLLVAAALPARAGISGMAHLFEHMLFKGTPTLGTHDYAAEQRFFPRVDAVADSFAAEFRKGEEADTTVLARLRDRLHQLEDSARAFVVSNELDRILTENGAVRLNASTFNDGTNYYFSLPSNRAELWFVLESDRIRATPAPRGARGAGCRAPSRGSPPKA